MEIPKSRAELVKQPVCASFATIMPDGSPQISEVWFRYEAPHFLVSMESHSQKLKNIERNPHVAMTIVDPSNPYSYLEVRGCVVEIVSDIGREWIDETSQHYTGKPYFGQFVPEDDSTPIIVVKIEPTRLRANGA